LDRIVAGPGGDGMIDWNDLKFLLAVAEPTRVWRILTLPQLRQVPRVAVSILSARRSIRCDRSSPVDCASIALRFPLAV
jgi:hypothetical protein